MLVSALAAGVSEKSVDIAGKSGTVPTPDAPPGSSPPGLLTSFVGRRIELEDIGDLLTSVARLVTIIGPPGIGKTRLANAYRLKASTPSLVCDLRTARFAGDVCVELGRALGAQLDSGTGLDELRHNLGAALALRGPSVVVFDNFEQLVPDASTTLLAWLHAAPHARFLVTSRQALQVEGEHVYELGPLALPQDEEDATCDAARLFMDRVRALEPSVELTSVPQRQLVDLVRLLEGNPLAIELAAGQINRARPQELVRDLDKRMLDLTTDRRDADPRHSSLRAALDTSWHTLATWERAAFCQLAVCRAGFTLAAARAVVDLDDYPEAPPLADVIAALRTRSLLRVSGASDPLRWDTYEALRTYGLEHLEEIVGGETDTVLARHARYFLDAGEQWASDISTWRGHHARTCLFEELPNLREAFAWFCRQRSTSTENVARLAMVLHVALHHTMPALAIDVLTQALDVEPDDIARVTLLVARAESRHAAGDIPGAEADLTAAIGVPCTDRLVARIQHQTGMCLHARGEPLAAFATLEQGVLAAERTGDAQLTARLHAAVGWVLAEGLHDTRASRHLERAATLLRQTSDGYAKLSHRILSCGLQVYCQRGDATEELLQLLPEIREFSDRRMEAMIHQALGIRALDLGQAMEAERRFAIARDVALRAGLQRVHMSVGYAMSLDEQDKHLAAANAYRAAAEIANRSKNRRTEANCLIILSGLLARQGDYDTAREVLEANRPIIVKTGDAGYRAVADAQRGQIELAEARQAADRGALRRSEGLRNRALQRVRRAKALRAPGGRSTPNRSLLSRSPALRFVVRLLERELRTGGRTREPLHVWQGGIAFRVGTRPTVELTRGLVLRRILIALAEQRASAPGRAMSAEALIDCGWPEERILEDAATQRLHTAITRLRQRGLSGLLLRRDDGYLLDPEVPFRLSESSVPDPAR